MNSLFWPGLNFIGFTILIFMYTHIDKRKSVKTTDQKLFGYLLLSVMFYLITDTGMFLLEGTRFYGAIILNYAFSLLFYLSGSLPSLLYLFYCDNKILKNRKGFKKRIVFYLLPVIVYSAAVLSTPFTRIIFYINDENMYTRGNYFWISTTLSFLYVIAVFVILIIKRKKYETFFKSGKIYLYLFPIPPVILTIIQLMNYGVLLVGFGFVLSAVIMNIYIIQHPEDRRSLAGRFHNLNIIQFAVISSVMMASMFFVFEKIINRILADHADVLDSSSLIGAPDLLPVFLITLVVLILFAYTSNTITTKLIFTPLTQLINSLINMRKNNEHNLFGVERSDEIGLLSNAIQDYFVKGYYDELTGIFNRRYLETTLQQMLTTMSRTNIKLSVMIIDIDFFKKYNDTYGHGQGDNCLKLIAQTLNKEIMRKGDFVARYGGEEFAVILPSADQEGALRLAENMLLAVRKLKIPHEKSNYGIVTVSIGLTTRTGGRNINRDDFLKKADEALYTSKETGRNRFTFRE